MIEQLPRQRVLNFLDAFYGGDSAAALKCCDDDIESMVYLPVELFPHLGPRRGTAAIAELIGIHAARYSKQRFDVRFLVADDVRAAVIIDLSFTKRTDGRVLTMPSGLFFTLRRGPDLRTVELLRYHRHGRAIDRARPRRPPAPRRRPGAAPTATGGVRRYAQLKASGTRSPRAVPG